MFFTKMAGVAAWVIFVLAVIRLVMGFLLAFGADDPTAAARIYLGSGTTGEAIDQGFRWLGYAIIFGVLSEISKSLRPSGSPE
ncbi:hypothetical protein ACFFKB_25885 [Mameliella alba]|uniref:hypothetical protein n=1 Tax=Mameliella alba TaxID=561184 RepID=UPI001055C49A|nr:hypothetical protein [Mameliella alba]